MNEITTGIGPISNQDAVKELEALIKTINLNRATVIRIDVKKEYVGRSGEAGCLKEINVKFATW
jgi:hypothetical protein